MGESRSCKGRVRWAGLLIVLTAVVVATSARGQPRGEAQPWFPYPPGLQLFPIVLVGQPSELRVTLSTEENAKPFLYCTGRCEAWAYKGTYRVAVRSTRLTAAGQKEIRLKRPCEIKVRARERNETSAPTTVGLVLLPAGLGMIAFGAVAARNEHDAATRVGPLLVYGGVATVVAALVLLIVGGARDTTTPEVSITP